MEFQLKLTIRHLFKKQHVICCMDKFIESVGGQGVELWTKVLNELESVLSEADELLSKHQKFHGYISQDLNRFSKIQGMPLPSFMKENGQLRTKQEWKEKLGNCLFCKLLDRVMDDDRKVVENLQVELSGLYQLEFSARILNKVNATLVF